MPLHQMFFLPESRFCIIAGNGQLPQVIASAIKAAGHKVSLLLLKQDAKQDLYKEFDTETIAYGQVDTALKFLKCHKTEYLIFAGGLEKPDLKSIKVDIKGGILLARLLKAKLFGDDHLLRIIAEFFEEQGLKVISPTDVVENLTLSYEDIGTITNDIKQDISLGVKASKLLGSLDIGQAAIVENGCVIAVEGIEGTDQLIERSAQLRRKHGQSAVLVKSMKDNQDKRLDIPCIGPETIKQLAAHNYQGLAVERNKVIILESDEVFALVRTHRMFLHFFVA